MKIVEPIVIMLTHKPDLYDCDAVQASVQYPGETVKFRRRFRFDMDGSYNEVFGTNGLAKFTQEIVTNTFGPAFRLYKRGFFARILRTITGAVEGFKEPMIRPRIRMEYDGPNKLDFLLEIGFWIVRRFGSEVDFVHSIDECGSQFSATIPYGGRYIVITVFLETHENDDAFLQVVISGN